ncbi:MAG: hypothetical protein AABX03_03240 [Nanoarchaeota archaeon]
MVDPLKTADDCIETSNTISRVRKRLQDYFSNGNTEVKPNFNNIFESVEDWTARKLLELYHDNPFELSDCMVEVVYAVAYTVHACDSDLMKSFPKGSLRLLEEKFPFKHLMDFQEGRGVKTRTSYEGLDQLIKLPRHYLPISR